MIHTHEKSFTFIQCCNLLGEAGKQNEIFLFEREQVKLCFKVKVVRHRW